MNGRGAGLRIRLLGGFSIDGVAERELGSRKARTLVKLLALERGTTVSSERAADVLWTENRPARPIEQVGVLVSRIRGVIGSDRLTRSPAGYALTIEWLDIDELAARVDEAGSALVAGRIAAARAAAGAALMLARGPLLPEDEGEWLEADRAAVDVLVRRAREVAMDAAAAGGDHGSAGSLAEQALARDPYDEHALRVLMRAHVAAGRPGSALAAFARVRDRLRDDLGAAPTADTDALHREVLSLDGATSGARPATAPRPEPSRIVGRERELTMLDDALAAVRGGAGASIVEIVGEPGIGKSALVAEWTSRAAAGGATILAGRCDELGRDLPLQPIVGAVGDWLSGLGRSGAAVALGADLATVGVLFGVSESDAIAATQVLDPDVARLQLFASILAVIQRAGDKVVLAIDDVHLAGGATLAWMAFAVGKPVNLLIVTTSRDAGPGVGGAQRIGLGPLDVDAVAALVGAERATELWRSSNGNPLMLVALANADAGELPADARDAIRGWAASLGDAASTIRTAAALGEAIDLDVLAAVVRRPAVDVLVDLEAAVRAGVLEERDAGFAFRHGHIREVLEQDLGSSRRALTHRAAAAALNERVGVDPLAVAVHARLGGELSLAVTALVAASAMALDRHDLDAAEALLDEALALQPSALARTARARVRMIRLDLRGAADDAAAAVAADGGAAALEVAGWVAYYDHDYDAARRFGDEGVERATDASLRTSCLALGGRARHGAGDLRGAAERLAAAASAGAPPAVRGVADVWLSQVQAHTGQPDEALRSAERALIDADRLAHPFAALHGRFAQALALGQLGQPAAALRACTELDAAIESVGVVGDRMLGPAANTRAWILRWTGHGRHADELNRGVLEFTSDAASRLEARYAAMLDLADGRVLAGDLAGAAAMVDRLAAIESWSGTMAWYHRHRYDVLRSRLALADGDADRAAEFASAAERDAAMRGARRHALIAAAVAGAAGGRPTESLDAVVSGLAGCAGVDGWYLVADLARRFDHDGWRREAERRAALVVARSTDAESARRFVDTVLG